MEKIIRDDQLGWINNISIIISLVGMLIGLIVLIYVITLNIMLFVKAKSKESKINQRDLFYKLSQQTGYTDVKLFYGKRKRVNNHFNYRAAYHELHLAKWYEETNTQKGTMLMLYNFSNILDIRKQSTNFWSRSIYCHIFAFAGLMTTIITGILALTLNYGKFPLQHLNLVLPLVTGVGLLLLLLSCLWWRKIAKKMVKTIDKMAKNTLEENEYKEVMKNFKKISSIPFTINTSIIIPRKHEYNNKKYDGPTPE